MPNMDDIAFFDSSQYHHRGGIWQDASRRVSSFVEHPSDANEGQFAPPVDATLGEESKPSTQALQASEVCRVEDGLSSPTRAHHEDTMVAPANNDVADASPSRPRSWFSSVRSDDINILSGMDAFTDGDLDDELRGPSAQSKKFRATPQRSQSTSKESELPNDVGRQERGDRWPSEDTHLSPKSASRSSSRSSFDREPAKSSSVDSSFSSLDLTRTPPKNVSTPSTSTFLSTLKSRAGDKQALSNTAKEAIRKWGVNWGGSRKDSYSENSDHGSIISTIGSKLRPESTLNVGTKSRASYAEVKAAVAERRGRDVNHPDEDSSRSRSTSPVLVSGRTRSQTRAVSNPGSEGGSYTESSTLSASPAAFQERRLSTSSSTSRKSNPSGPYLTVGNDGHEELGPLQSTPPIVHVQPPKATMMTIPGIHASHRGEIMSMGYSAPQTASSTASLEGKSAIQNVYRLWKIPASSADQQPTSVQSSSQDIDPPVPKEDRNADPLNIAPRAPSPQPLPAPPPLPPRSIPISPSLPEPVSSNPAATSASKSLQIIANNDEVSRRNSLERNIDLPSYAIAVDSSHGSPPPLPPRRTHAQQA